MSFILAEAVPWGRSFDEYVSMFALSDADLAARIIGCGDGPASFNATLSLRGGRVVSVDPLYVCDANAIRARIREATPIVLEQLRQNAAAFVWRAITSIDMLADVRQRAMALFLDDYAAAGRGHRYVAAALPAVPFAAGAFDIALCSHFLFLYSEQFPLGFHLASLRELCRVAADVRVFPLLELGGTRSRHLDQVVGTLRSEGYDAVVQEVGYEFQHGGNEMLRVRRSGESGLAMREL